MNKTSTNTSISTKNKEDNEPKVLIPAIQTTEIISMDRAKELSQQLIEFVKRNNLSIDIAGNNYLMVEAWQFIGTQMGLTDVVQSCDPIAPFEDPKEIKYKAVVDIVNQLGVVVSRGFAWCSSKESKKARFEEYAIASMAQTRAIGKAYRNINAWIVKMAGYEATPAEEINKDSMEADLSKSKQQVLKVLNENGIVEADQMMDYIEKTIQKRSIDTVKEANQVIDSFEEIE